MAGVERRRRLVLALALVLTSVTGAGATAATASPATGRVGVVSAGALPARELTAPRMSCKDLLRADFSAIAGAPAHLASATIGRAVDGSAMFCIVRGYVAPTIEFQLDLPIAGWTGRYLQGGCGGNCGVVMRRFMPDDDNRIAYAGAFAVGFEDSGHRGGDGVWALGGRRVRADFAFHAAHAFAIAAKAVIRTFYGRPPAFAYFDGCSDGGREGMVETQRYPGDFDGVVAGSPAFAISEAMERFIWEARWGNAHGTPVFDLAAVKLLHAAVLASCDRLDGVADGESDDPRRCRFDPASLQCPTGRPSPRCLSARQVTAARKFYQGPVDRRGRHLYFGGEPYSSELSWVQPFSLAGAGEFMFRNTVEDMIFLHRMPPDAGVRTWRFDAAQFRRLARLGAMYDAGSADLRAFRARGGKLILWQGFADPAAGAYGLPDYYARLAAAAGGLSAERRFARLFMVPGVYHCGGGYIPYQEHYLSALVDWVERGRAPSEVLAVADLGQGRIRRRPVYAYPVESRYVGHGDVDAPGSFVPKMPSGRRDDRYRLERMTGRR